MGQPPQGSRRYGFAPGSPSRESIRSQNSLYDDRASSVGTQESNAISSRSTVTSRHFVRNMKHTYINTLASLKLV
ncbi:hypothetical protein EON65_27985 [archaeon]|nr:MAG: hypothetical protein EON65_27985 [archaeon]